MRTVLHLCLTILFADALYAFVDLATGSTTFGLVVAGLTGLVCGVLSARMLRRLHDSE